MKYRVVELLQCPRCHADLEVVGPEHRVSADRSGSVFRCRRYCALERRSSIPGPEACAECGRTEIVSGALACLGCGQKFRIVEGIPWLFDEQVLGADRPLSGTADLYSHLWRNQTPEPSASTHFQQMEDALEEPIVHGDLGLDAGSGCGSDTATMARRYPHTELLSLDLSEGVYATKQATATMPNVHVIRGSVLDLPLRSESCDFVYSFGVLLHTPNPLKGLQEMARVLKTFGRVALYLYEDHADNLWKAIPLKAVTVLRVLTVKLHPQVLSGLCYLLSPFVVLMFSIPARIMMHFRGTRKLAERMPFNFGTSLFSVQADLLDRLGAPIEERFSQADVETLLKHGGVTKQRICKLKDIAGWAVSATKGVQ